MLTMIYNKAITREECMSIDHAVEAITNRIHDELYKPTEVEYNESYDWFICTECQTSYKDGDCDCDCAHRICRMLPMDWVWADPEGARKRQLVLDHLNALDKERKK